MAVHAVVVFCLGYDLFLYKSKSRTLCNVTTWNSAGLGKSGTHCVYCVPVYLAAR